MDTATSDNVALIEGAYTAFAEGDVEAVVGGMDPAIEWNEAEHSLWHEPGGHRGPGEVVSNVFARIPEDFDHFEVVAHQLHGAGDTVIVEGRYRGTAKATGKPLDAQVCHVWTLRDGKVVGFQQYTDTWQIAEVTGHLRSPG